MRISDKRSPLSYIPGYSENAVLQLIVASATGFIIYHFIRVVLLVAGMDPSYFNIHFVPNLALQEVHGYASKFWVIFTYGWTHSGFWELFSNMVWLYAFGTIIQTLISYKQIIPLFVYSMIVGGLFYELSQLIPGADTSAYVIGAQAAIVGVATAAFTLSPKYRFYLASEFS
ncbi:MAG: rhomboid family intramembrane serine protease, partial [Flavipsychrobacter sp.]